MTWLCLMCRSASSRLARTHVRVMTQGKSEQVQQCKVFEPMLVFAFASIPLAKASHVAGPGFERELLHVYGARIQGEIYREPVMQSTTWDNILKCYMIYFAFFRVLAFLPILSLGTKLNLTWHFRNNGVGGQLSIVRVRYLREKRAFAFQAAFLAIRLAN